MPSPSLSRVGSIPAPGAGSYALSHASGNPSWSRSASTVMVNSRLTPEELVAGLLIKSRQEKFVASIPPTGTNPAAVVLKVKKLLFELD